MIFFFCTLYIFRFPLIVALLIISVFISEQYQTRLDLQANSSFHCFTFSIFFIIVLICGNKEVTIIFRIDVCTVQWGGGGVCKPFFLLTGH